jgi:predicted RNase H-like HicB family nuclease
MYQPHRAGSREATVVIAIDVEPIVRDLRADVTELSAAREIDVRVRGRGYRAVLTPDLEAGGYTIEVPELAGCITEADTLSEARRMTREAIEPWLDAAAPHIAHRRAHAR